VFLAEVDDVGRWLRRSASRVWTLGSQRLETTLGAPAKNTRRSDSERERHKPSRARFRLTGRATVSRCSPGTPSIPAALDPAERDSAPVTLDKGFMMATDDPATARRRTSDPSTGSIAVTTRPVRQLLCRDCWSRTATPAVTARVNQVERRGLRGHPWDRQASGPDLAHAQRKERLQDGADATWFGQKYLRNFWRVFGVDGRCLCFVLLQVTGHFCWSQAGALDRIRTCDTRFRKPMLYPLSYEGGHSTKDCQENGSLQDHSSVCRLPWMASGGYRRIRRDG
jgi:hypothetical protein